MAQPRSEEQRRSRQWVTQCANERCDDTCQSGKKTERQSKGPKKWKGSMGDILGECDQADVWRSGWIRKVRRGRRSVWLTITINPRIAPRRVKSEIQCESDSRTPRIRTGVPAPLVHANCQSFPRRIQTCETVRTRLHHKQLAIGPIPIYAFCNR